MDAVLPGIQRPRIPAVRPRPRRRRRAPRGLRHRQQRTRARARQGSALRPAGRPRAPNRGTGAIFSDAAPTFRRLPSATLGMTTAQAERSAPSGRTMAATAGTRHAVFHLPPTRLDPENHVHPRAPASPVSTIVTSDRCVGMSTPKRCKASASRSVKARSLRRPVTIPSELAVSAAAHSPCAFLSAIRSIRSPAVPARGATRTRIPRSAHRMPRDRKPVTHSTSASSSMLVVRG